MCMCICIPVCRQARMGTYVCMYINAHITYIYMQLWINVYMYTCMHVYVYMLYGCKYSGMYIGKDESVCVCIH